MKILQVNKFFYPFGGSETYFFSLRESLTDQGHEIIDFAMEDKRNLDSRYSKYFVSHVDYKNTNNFFHKLKAAGRIVYSFEARRKIEALIKETNPDIVHLHNFYHQISPSILSVFKKHDLPVVMTAHDYKALCPNYRMFTQGKPCERCKQHNYYNAIKHKCLKNSRMMSVLVAIEMYLHRWWLKSYFKNIDILIAPSEFMRNKFIEWGWKKDKIVHLPNFTNLKNLDKFKRTKVESQYALYFGRLSHEKGIAILIRAMALVESDIKLKIVGDGPNKQEYIELAKRLGVDNKIEFVGFLAGDELYQVVIDSQFTIMPSIVYENNPLAVIESMALGRAVVGAKIGGIPELVIHKQTGLCFRSQDNHDLARKLDFAWQYKEQMNQMGQNGKNLVYNTLTTRNHLKKISAIYKYLKKNKQK